MGVFLVFICVEGGVFYYVKFYGVLYNMVVGDWDIVKVIVEVVYNVSEEVILYGLVGSELIKVGNEIGLCMF